MGRKSKVKSKVDATKLPIPGTKKKKRLTVKKPLKFTVDTKGGWYQSKTKVKKGPKHALGDNPLAEKERELAADLFGDNGELSDDARGEEHLGATDQECRERKEKIVIKDKGPTDDPLDPYPQTNKKPAWTDEDDQNIRVKDVVAGMTKARGSRGVREVSEDQYSHSLQQKFTQAMGGIPEWARLHSLGTKEDDIEEEEEGKLTKGTADYLSRGRSEVLGKTRLEYRRVRHLNHTSRTEGAIITATEFNPHHHVALVAGFSTTVIGAATLFKVDGAHNHIIHSVKFPKFPIKCAKFLCDGNKFVAGSNQHGHFYVYDLEAAQETKIPSNLSQDRRSMKNFVVSPDGELLVFLGKKGQLHIFDTTSLSHVDTLYAPGDITSAAFNPSGSRLYTHTIGGDVFVWDMSARACVHRFYDDGCINGTSIAVSPNSQYLACGSSSGVVNVYDLAGVTDHAPTPVKMLDRLRTSVSALTFNSTSEVLATASDQLENAIKLVHFPSMTYFNNFPGAQNTLRRVQVLNFSPQSGFLAVGNNHGTAFLYRLQHYTSY